MRIDRRSKHALSVGALIPISTEQVTIEDGGIPFLVRIGPSLAEKSSSRDMPDSRTDDPFLPYEEDLYVADVTASHVALLNKYSVVDHHLLIVTREFEDQEMLLTRKDFEALWTCMLETDGLGFYNAGPDAGASQAHKHLQIVPVPVGGRGAPVPIEPFFTFHDQEKGASIPQFPFRHTIRMLGKGFPESPTEAAERLMLLYGEMLRQTGLYGSGPLRPSRQTGAYCLIVTRRWILIVPRSCECFEEISINALGFAGALLVRSRDQLARLEAAGPIRALEAVSQPVPGGGLD